MKFRHVLAALTLAVLTLAGFTGTPTATAAPFPTRPTTQTLTGSIAVINAKQVTVIAWSSCLPTRQACPRFARVLTAQITPATVITVNGMPASRAHLRAGMSVTLTAARLAVPVHCLRAPCPVITRTVATSIAGRSPASVSGPIRVR